MRNNEIPKIDRVSMNSTKFNTLFFFRFWYDFSLLKIQSDLKQKKTNKHYPYHKRGPNCFFFVSKKMISKQGYSFFLCVGVGAVFFMI